MTNKNVADIERKAKMIQVIQMNHTVMQWVEVQEFIVKKETEAAIMMLGGKEKKDRKL